MKQITQKSIAAIGEAIDIQEGIQMVNNYKSQYPLNTSSYVIGKDIIQSILAQGNCEGIRLYNAIGPGDDQTLVCLGINKTGQLLAPVRTVKRNGELCQVLPIVADRMLPGNKVLEDDLEGAWGMPD